MGKRKDEQQLKLLNCGDNLELSKFKKRTKLKAVRVFRSKEQEAEFFDNRTYKSKEGKKLYEIYVSIRLKGKRLQTRRRRKDLQGKFISSLPTARKVEFELKRELVGQKEGQPIWKWEGWLEECLRRMQFSLKHSTVNNYRKILNKWIPKFWSEEELQNLTKADVHNLIFESMFSTTPHQKKNLHKALRRIFEMAVEEGAINKNPARGIKVTYLTPYIIRTEIYSVMSYV